MLRFVKQLFGNSASEKSVRENSPDDLVVERKMRLDKDPTSGVYFETIVLVSDDRLEEYRKEYLR